MLLLNKNLDLDSSNRSLSLKIFQTPRYSKRGSLDPIYWHECLFIPRNLPRNLFSDLYSRYYSRWVLESRRMVDW